MANSELFSDWAIVKELEEDILKLQLSRDELPSEVQLVSSSVINLRIGKEGKGYKSSGYFISTGEETGEILLHLTGDVVTSELREFYRLDLYLPFKYQFDKEQNLDKMLAAWRRTKQQRIDDEVVRKEAYQKKKRDLVFRAATGEFDEKGDNPQGTNRPQIEEYNPLDESWDNISASAMNLSAGGFKFVTTDHFESDQLVFFEMLIPSSPPKIMDSVARVVFKNKNHQFSDQYKIEHFNIAIQFVFIDERDRDLIYSHISQIESLRIRQSRQIPIRDLNVATSTISPLTMKIAFCTFVLLAIAITVYFYIYAQNKTNNEIQEDFQKGIKKYIEKLSK